MNNKTYLRFFIALFLMLGIILNTNPTRVIAESELEELLLDEKTVKVTLDLQDASLRDVLKMLSVQSGLNFIASEAVAERKITLYLDNVPARDAMDKIFKANNLAYELDSESNIFMVRDWGKPGLELDTRVYFLKYIRVANSRLNQGLGSTSASTSSSSTSTSASASISPAGSTSGGESGTATAINGLKDALDTVISEYGKIIEDPATNSMIITDMPSKFTMIEQLITKLDVPIPQVMIEVEILDVNKSTVDKLGFKWPQSLLQLTVPGARATKFPFGAGKGTSGADFTIDPGVGLDVPAYGASHFAPSILTVIGATLSLDFFRSQADTKFLARPKLFVLNNETAQLKLSSNEAIGAGTTTQNTVGSTTTASAERAETGVSLKVTPQISMATGEITVILEPVVKEAVASSISIGTQILKDVEERSVKSTVRVKDGETVIIGGLIRQKKPTVETKAGLLGEIPILGMLFRHKDTSGSQDRELLVFITPKIIKSSPNFTGGGRQLAPKMLGERKQDDFISAERQEIVSQTLGRYEIKPLAK